MSQQYKILADCHQKSGERHYRIKVSFPEMNMHINGFTALSPNEQYPEWHVMAPSFKAAGNTYKPVVEFAKKDGENGLWVAIHDACIKSAKEREEWEKRLANERPMYQ